MLLLLIHREVPLAPDHLAVPFERQDVRRDAVQEPAVVQMTTAQPAKFISASSSARSVSTSRSLVGSSSNSKLPPLRNSFAR